MTKNAAHQMVNNAMKKMSIGQHADPVAMQAPILGTRIPIHGLASRLGFRHRASPWSLHRTLKCRHGSLHTVPNPGKTATTQNAVRTMVHSALKKTNIGRFACPFAQLAKMIRGRNGVAKRWDLVHPSHGAALRSTVTRCSVVVATNQSSWRHK